MAVTVKRVTIWSTRQADEAGVLARVLEPLVRARMDLQIVMGYRIPDEADKAVIEIAPVTGVKAEAAARAAGFTASMLPGLLVQGDNWTGLGHAFGVSLAEAG